jgi:asparagine synthase (glutamine-hydrolysing)
VCGIAGRAGHAKTTTPFADGVLSALQHRGPDMQRVAAWDVDGVEYEFAFARLSIVDLSESATQPMTNEDESLVMMFNGEIYNSPELRRECEDAGHHFRSRMDGEVILHLWEMEGTQALARLNGIFAVALLNRSTGELFLARDPIGVKPLFYTQQADRLWFASELTALVAAGAPVGTHDLVALAQFLSFLWIPDPRTPYVNAHSLEPGHVLRWRRGNGSLHRYTPALHPAEAPARIAASDVVAETEQRLDAAVQRQLLSDVPIGLMASGGVDSSLLWWSARDALDRAFNIEWADAPGSEGLHEDTAAVHQLSNRLGTPVDFIRGEQAPVSELGPAGDLLADPAYGLTKLIAGAAQTRGLKVLLSGQGGDELFAGYRRHRVARLLQRAPVQALARMTRRPVQRLGSRGLRSEYATRFAHAAAEREPLRAYMQLCTYSNALDRARALGCSASEVSDEIVWQRHRQVWEALPRKLSYLRKVMALDLTVYLPGLGLTYVDRAGMEYGVEIRVPWLDLDFVRWTLTLPDNALILHGRGKWVPRMIAERRLGRDAAHRPKRGFGAPIERIQGTSRSQGVTGTRGFRQGEYFSLAATLLQSFSSGHEQRAPTLSSGDT